MLIACTVLSGCGGKMGEFEKLQGKWQAQIRQPDKLWLVVQADGSGYYQFQTDATPKFVPDLPLMLRDSLGEVVQSDEFNLKLGAVKATLHVKIPFQLKRLDKDLVAFDLATFEASGECSEDFLVYVERIGRVDVVTALRDVLNLYANCRA